MAAKISYTVGNTPFNVGEHISGAKYFRRLRRRLFKKYKKKCCYCGTKTVFPESANYSNGNHKMATVEHKYNARDIRRSLCKEVVLACYKCNQETRKQSDVIVNYNYDFSEINLINHFLKQTKMKTTYNLKEFHAKVVEISHKESKLVKVGVNYGIYHKWEFNCYVHGLPDIINGDTPEEVLFKLTSIVNSASNTINVEFELEQLELEESETSNIIAPTLERHGQ